MVHCSECVCRACKAPNAPSATETGMHWYLPSDGGRAHWYLTRRETPTNLPSDMPGNASWSEDAYWPAGSTYGDTSTHWYLTTGPEGGGRHVSGSGEPNVQPDVQPSAPMEEEPILPPAIPPEQLQPAVLL